MRTPDYRLIVTHRNGSREGTDIELYDLTAGDDPLENLANARADVVEELLQYVKQ